MPMGISLFYIVYKSFQSLCSPETSLELARQANRGLPSETPMCLFYIVSELFQPLCSPVVSPCNVLAQAQQLSWQSSCLIVKRSWVRILHKLSQSEPRFAQQDANNYLRSRQAKQTVDCRARRQCVFLHCFRVVSDLVLTSENKI